jgi:hypothetical protein
MSWILSKINGMGDLTPIDFYCMSKSISIGFEKTENGFLIKATSGEDILLKEVSEDITEIEVLEIIKSFSRDERINKIIK